MKKTTLLLILSMIIVSLIVFASCQKDEATEPQQTEIIEVIPEDIHEVLTETIPNYEMYFGCWFGVSSSEYYDIIINEDTITGHKFELGNNCNPILDPLDCYFRNDTLIIDNNTFTYWCYIVSDTLIYSYYGDNPIIAKYEKY